MSSDRFAFEPARYEKELIPLIQELAALDEIDAESLQRILRQYPKDGRGLFSKSEIVRGFRFLEAKTDWIFDGEAFLDRLRSKPVRTLSGVAPVTVLTKPYPCPGRCIFCPSDVRMPKSYLSDEPGAQRAARHQFDPYRQTLWRLVAFHHNAHRIDKVELIILGGTWSSYREEYQIWFVTRCFDAMNDFSAIIAQSGPPALDDGQEPAIDFRRLDERIDGRSVTKSYNQIVSEFAGSAGEDSETRSWTQLAAAQTLNETADSRCVGLVVETRPDHLSLAEAVRMRRLGATKVQIGFQSLDDKVLRLNHRGHDVATTRRAVEILRTVGFKIHAHWMPNLYGSSPKRDIEDFERLFADPSLRPDELKIYPCSLIESAELMSYFEAGLWRPYTREELLEVLTACLIRTPEYCRLTRIIRDIPGTDIVAGNRLTNFRELAEEALRERGLASRDIRSREIRSEEVDAQNLELRETVYETSGGREVFLQYATPSDHLAGFLRLSLPNEPTLAELSRSAMIREVHVYGLLTALGSRHKGRSQHSGLGRRLTERAVQIATAAGYEDLAVISAIGTRGYYRRLGFGDGELFQHRRLRRAAEPLTNAIAFAPSGSSTGRLRGPVPGS
ncbi:MAG: tRNA uridine(34) 5-carboxymethylaminomethyl modification radical SAM/GNAT enzyme Elp3 [Acidobacteriota bacterium]|nr:tRNA uridine(34) 5-carboxymethylaminomethyl modification radical SAM/GNAT enzyme Elp3 [Acidobacteriota bacterium]